MTDLNPHGRVNAHDIFVRKAMADPRVAQEFMQAHLPTELLDKMDIHHLVLQPRSYINDLRQETIVDLLYQTTIAGYEAYLFLLIEHQSTPDPLMPFRMLKYTCNVMDEYLQTGTQKCLPFIYPLVIYHGQRAYPYSTDIKDLVDAPKDIVKRYFLQPFQLLDLGQIDDTILKQHTWTGVMEMALKHIYARDILPHLRDMMKLFRRLEQSGGRDFVEIVLEYMLSRGELSSKKEFFNLLNTELTPSTGGNLMTFAEQMREEGRQEVRAETQAFVEQLKAEVRQEARAEVRTFGEQLKEEGRQEVKLEVAKHLLSEGAQSVFISKITGLPLAKIEKLQETAAAT